jgi:hypothetical protein
MDSNWPKRILHHKGMNNVASKLVEHKYFTLFQVRGMVNYLFIFWLLKAKKHPKKFPCYKTYKISRNFRMKKPHVNYRL